ncbi:MAG: B12-binding domain-containing radical SAM protein [Pirellulales bacterium]|nr:B12-binding domain-containing radical SAM protein [Pirellulales bacterium]
MRILLVNPAQEETFFGFSEVVQETGVSGYMPNLALPTLAALTPSDIELTLVDEQVEDVPREGHWDLVGITGYISQSRRMFEIADDFRKRGLLVAIGGPYATLSSATVRPHCDILFTGEAEETWPQFLDDFRRGAWQTQYAASAAAELEQSPLPKIEALKPDAYWVGVVQTSRGCPFSCEFCDVIVYLGRKQRHKSPQRVVTELERLYAAGYRSVFLSDDNFTAARKRAADIMQAVGNWNRRQPERTYFATQLSIDVVRDEQLLELCSWAGLKQAFVGLETPTADALREVKKNQNVRQNMVADVQTLHKNGIMVNGGIITGFDSDTPATFRVLYDFVQAAGFPMVNVNMLHAPEGTPLERRMRDEGRLRGDYAELGSFSTNVVPKQMSLEQLRRGTQWLLNKLYAPQPLLERIASLAEHLPVEREMVVTGARSAAIWQRLLDSYEALGEEYALVPRRAVRHFRGKDTSALMTALIFGRQAIGVMQRRKIYDLGLGQLEEPDFEALAVVPS